MVKLKRCVLCVHYIRKSTPPNLGNFVRVYSDMWSDLYFVYFLPPAFWVKFFVKFKWVHFSNYGYSLFRWNIWVQVFLAICYYCTLSFHILEMFCYINLIVLYIFNICVHHFHSIFKYVCVRKMMHQWLCIHVQIGLCFQYTLRGKSDVARIFIFFNIRFFGIAIHSDCSVNCNLHSWIHCVILLRSPPPPFFSSPWLWVCPWIAAQFNTLLVQVLVIVFFSEISFKVNRNEVVH